MTIKVENVCHTTDLLISRQPRRHYRTSVSHAHWQLRSLIGVSKPDTIYYPGGRGNLHIQKLNTVTREAETVKLLSFSPRCLVAKNGWVCCGGETGEFAAINVDGNDTDIDSDADARLPMSLDSSRQEDVMLSLLARSRSSSKNIMAKTKAFGLDRVNCITLWFPPTQLPAFAGAYQRGVAVLANNDKHVTVVNLATLEALDDLSYPDCVNRGVLSPDGRLLIAISDDPYLYVHERVEVEHSSGQTYRSREKSNYEWRLCNKVHLKGQRRDDDTQIRGSFAACFSNTGKYLAVGTQYGMILLFNTSALIDGEDGLLTCFASSMADSRTAAGAVREMAFCPGPFDLLAWSEDRGAVGVADVRSNFVARQILKLGDESAYDHLSLNERSTIDPRLLDSRNDRGDSIASNLSSTLDAPSDARRSARARDLLDRYQYPLTADETQVLEALQDHRRRREQREQRERNAVQDYLGPRTPWSSRPSARSTLASDNSRSRERSVSVSRAVNDILGNIQTQRDRIREAQERLRAREATEAERRRPGTAVTARRSGITTRATDTEEPSRRESLMSRLMANPVAGGWDNLEALYNISFEGGSAYESLRMLEGETRDRASFLGSLINQPPSRDVDDELAQLRLRDYGGDYGVSRLSRNPDETAGLAWSEDGSIIYVGAEDGIYEFHVNIVARKLFPSITMR